jgi:methylthioribose-1-phosphate isomerase
MRNPLPPVQWDKDELWILDQRKLPSREVWIRCHEVETVANAIESLAVRGAPLIGITAAYGVALAARRKDATRESTLEAIERLRETRQTGYNLFYELARMERVVKQRRGRLAERALVEARQIHTEDAVRCEAMAAHGANVMAEGEQVLTYCNTGALATGGIGTALGVVQTAFHQKKVAHVFVCETRPLAQGARLTLWELVRATIPCTLICDNMAAALMATGEVQRVLVGADRIACNGDTANKIGTYALALMAAYYEIPFHVVAPSTTVDVSIKSAAEMELEERDPRELTRGIPGLARLQGYDVWNPAFDITPAGLIQSFITERGTEEPPFA